MLLVRFVVLVTVLSHLVSAPAFAAKSEKVTSTTTIVWPPIPKGDMSRLVPEAMKQARLGNSDLAASVSRRSDEALPYLEKYSHAKDDETRSAIERIASASHSRLALHLLSNILIQPDETSGITQTVLRDITRGYSRVEILRWGDKALQKNVMQLARYRSYFSEAILLTASFRSRESVALLRDIRHRARPSDTLILDEFSPHAELAFVADIALAESENHDAWLRLRTRMNRKKVNDRVWLCHALPFIENRKILRLVASYLQDERIARTRSMFAMGTDGVCREIKEPPLRVCDVVARALQLKMQAKRWEGLYDYGPITAKEIMQVRQQFMRWL